MLTPTDESTRRQSPGGNNHLHRHENPNLTFIGCVLHFTYRVFIFLISLLISDVIFGNPVLGGCSLLCGELSSVNDRLIDTCILPLIRDAIRGVGAENPEYWEGINWEAALGILRIIWMLTLASRRDCCYSNLTYSVYPLSVQSVGFLEGPVHTYINFLSYGCPLNC
jgi:hypothetical protein